MDKFHSQLSNSIVQLCVSKGKTAKFIEQPAVKSSLKRFKLLEMI